MFVQNNKDFKDNIIKTLRDTEDINSNYMMAETAIIINLRGFDDSNDEFYANN